MADNRKIMRSGIFVVIGLILIFTFFLKPQTVFEEQYGDTGKPFGVEVKTYGTGFFNREISVIHYKVDGRTVKRENFTFFSRFTDEINVSWLIEPGTESWWVDNVVKVRMDYWVSQGLHDGEMKTKTTGYDFDDAAD